MDFSLIRDSKTNLIRRSLPLEMVNGLLYPQFEYAWIDFKHANIRKFPFYKSMKEMSDLEQGSIFCCSGVKIGQENDLAVLKLMVIVAFCSLGLNY